MLYTSLHFVSYLNFCDFKFLQVQYETCVDRLLAAYGGCTGVDRLSDSFDKITPPDKKDVLNEASKESFRKNFESAVCDAQGLLHFHY